MRGSSGAVLWDLDGTLIDSEAGWARACAQLSREIGVIPWDPEPAEISGISITGLAELLREYGARGRRQEIVEMLAERVNRLNRREGVVWRPGALDVLESVHRSGVRQALVTMSPTSIVVDILERLPRPYFTEVVTASMVSSPKPDPESYLIALRNLRVASDRSVAIEDSSLGMTSARAAGLNVIAVPHAQRVEAGAGIQVWDSLRNRGIEDLVAAGLQP